MTNIIAERGDWKDYKPSRLLKDFLSLVEIESASDPHSSAAPSTPSQLNVLDACCRLLREAGVEKIETTKTGLLYASIDAHPDCRSAPAVGFCAHMDTSPECSGENIRWRIIRYEGGRVLLNEEKEVWFDDEVFSDVKPHRGEDVVFTDGATLLGADDKAGVAAIIEAARYFCANPEIPHPEIRICFTPDEEVGRGTENLDPAKFGAAYAYTVDGGDVGGLDTETFNAASAEIEIEGLNTHPGSAKGRMVNASRAASWILMNLPEDEVPEKTEGYEGFIHPISMDGTVASARIELILRDHDEAKLEEKKKVVEEVCSAAREKFGAKINLRLADQYRNVSVYLKDHPYVAELARRAMKRLGLEVVEEPVRGGTDGCRISEMGIPCANIFAGGLNFHGRFECLPVSSLEKSAETIIEIIKLAAEDELSKKERIE